MSINTEIQKNSIPESEYWKEKIEVAASVDFYKWCMLTEIKFQQCSVSEDISHKDFVPNFSNILDANFNLNSTNKAKIS